MPNENDNKLVTLADLAEAYTALFNRDIMTSADKTKLDGIETGAQVNTITGVKGDAESSYRTGNVNITPANIGAVDKDGDTMTGPLTIGANIIQNSGFIKGQGDANTNHALKLGHNGDNVMQFLEHGGQFDFIKSSMGSNTTLFQIKNGVSDYPLPVNNGGTGATTEIGACENINAVNSKTDPTRRFYEGTHSVNDAPLGMTSYNGSDNFTQKPYSFWFDVFTFKSLESNYARQVAFPWGNNRSIAFRVNDRGTWSSWRYIATQTTEPTE